jgi:hypothetical protein
MLHHHNIDLMTNKPLLLFAGVDMQGTIKVLAGVGIESLLATATKLPAAHMAPCPQLCITLPTTGM